MMTKQDYEIIAEALSFARPIDDMAASPEARATWTRCRKEVADALEIQNGNFDADKFYRACGGAL